MGDPAGKLLAILMELYLFGHPFQEHVDVVATSLLNKVGLGGARSKLFQIDKQGGVFDSVLQFINVDKRWPIVLKKGGVKPCLKWMRKSRTLLEK